MEFRLEMEQSRLKLNSHFKYVLLYNKNNTKIPVVFSETQISENSAPEEVLSYINYIDTILDISEKLFEKVYIKIPKSSIRKISKNPRIYVPSDVILVGHIKDLEVAIIPSRGGLYAEIRDKNSKKIIHSYHTDECCVKRHLETIYYFVKSICR